MGQRVGIFLGADRARAALVETARRGRAPRVVARAEVPLDPLAWSGEPERAGAALATLALGMPSGARRADRPVVVALPDPVASEDRMVFRDLPGTPRELAELVRFRAARDLRRDADEIACAAQVMGTSDGGTEVVARIAPRAVIAAVTQGAHRAGFVPWRLDTWSGFALGEAARLAGSETGGRLWSDGAWWTLMCWSGPESHLHAEWRRGGDEEALAEKAARIAKAFALRCERPRLAVALDLDGGAAGAVARRLEGDPILAPVPGAPRLPDPALCVALA